MHRLIEAGLAVSKTAYSVAPAEAGAAGGLVLTSCGLRRGDADYVRQKAWLIRTTR